MFTKDVINTNTAKSVNKISVWSRKSIILPIFVGKIVDVYDGKKFISLKITPDMIGHKFGEFCLTRRYSHGKK
jgi:small subunit ribosomal protein S19